MIQAGRALDDEAASGRRITCPNYHFPRRPFLIEEYRAGVARAPVDSLERDAFQFRKDAAGFVAQGNIALRRIAGRLQNEVREEMPGQGGMKPHGAQRDGKVCAAASADRKSKRSLHRTIDEAGMKLHGGVEARQRNLSQHFVLAVVDLMQASKRRAIRYLPQLKLLIAGRAGLRMRAAQADGFHVQMSRRRGNGGGRHLAAAVDNVAAANFPCNRIAGLQADLDVPWFGVNFERTHPRDISELANRLTRGKFSCGSRHFEVSRTGKRLPARD